MPTATRSATPLPWLIDGKDVCASHSAADADILGQHGILCQSTNAVSWTAAKLTRGEAIASLESILKMPLHRSARLLGDIREPAFRYDVKMELSASVRNLLGELCASRIGAAVAAALGGPTKAQLCELSCIIAEPGARAQPAHCDTAADAADASDGAARLITCFVPLQDITAAMGPTLVHPGTHTSDFHAALKEEGALLLTRSEWEGVQMDVPAGSAVAMDSRLWHRGGANAPSSGVRRCLLVASFSSAGAPRPAGSTYSLLPHIEAQKLSMASLLDVGKVDAALHNPSGSSAVAQSGPADQPARTKFIACDSAYTTEDAEWLARNHRRKVLDTRVRIVGVAARSADGLATPAVLKCYPLRVTYRDEGAPESSEGTHTERRETRGGSSNKWTASAPVPWPNTFWLVDPQLAQRAGTLEHEGLVQTWQREVADEPDGDFARALATAHRAYSATRWALLSDDDRAYVLSQPWATAALRDTGVGGLRFESQVKCLHVHLAHALAGGDNPVGRRVRRLIGETPAEADQGIGMPGPPMAAEADEYADMPLAAVKLLARLAATLPPDEPRAKQCHTALEAAQGVPGGEAGTVKLSIAVLRQLSNFRVLGPHLRASPRFGPLQRCVDAAIASSVGAAVLAEEATGEAAATEGTAEQNTTSSQSPPPASASSPAMAAPSTASLADGLTPSALGKLQDGCDNVEGLLREVAGFAGDRPAMLRRLQLACASLTLSERQGVANALGRAVKAGKLGSTAPPPSHASLPLPPLTSIRATAAEALSLGLGATDEELLAGLRSLEARQALPLAHVRVLREALELGGPRIGFWTSRLTERGTEVALYDYADLAETLLGATSFVIYNAVHEGNVPAVQRRFEQRFGERFIGIDYQIELDGLLGGGATCEAGGHGEDTVGHGREAVGHGHGSSQGSLLRRLGLTHLYMMKVGGEADGPRVDLLRGHVRTCVHAVFDGSEPHGDTFARISPCVPGSAAPVVPHVVRTRQVHGPDLRSQLGIPQGATVFGRHGGYHTFDISFVRAAVLEVARARRDDIYFLFLNTAAVSDERLVTDEACPPNIIHLPDTLVDDEDKGAFIRTCDAMLHARTRGETFGLAISEFAAFGKPVLTSSVHHDGGVARFHLDVLAERGHYYHDKASCVELLHTFDRHAAMRKGAAHWQEPYRPYAPEKAMRAFRSIFLMPSAGRAAGGRTSVPAAPADVA